MNTNKPKVKILYYDLETTPIRAWIWRPGKQVVRHGQIDYNCKWTYTHIICITYCWNDGKPAKAFDWGYHKQDSAQMIEKFDKLIKKADVVIGKNSNRFDNKHLNFHRLMAGAPPMPDWIKYTDDLEVQMRKYFNVPSQSLDYWSKLFGLGGKIKMEFADWINIVDKHPKNGKSSFKKMVDYGKKDIEDTRALWEKLEAHIEPRYNAATKLGGRVCKHCGSDNIHKNGTRAAGKTIYQRYFCTDHGGYAGRASISATGKVGKLS